jgi:hypothetical protein
MAFFSLLSFLLIGFLYNEITIKVRDRRGKTIFEESDMMESRRRTAVYIYCILNELKYIDIPSFGEYFFDLPIVPAEAGMALPLDPGRDLHETSRAQSTLASLTLNL